MTQASYINMDVWMTQASYINMDVWMTRASYINTIRQNWGEMYQAVWVKNNEHGPDNNTKTIRTYSLLTPCCFIRLQTGRCGGCFMILVIMNNMQYHITFPP